MEAEIGRLRQIVAEAHDAIGEGDHGGTLLVAGINARLTEARGEIKRLRDDLNRVRNGYWTQTEIDAGKWRAQEIAYKLNMDTPEARAILEEPVAAPVVRVAPQVAKAQGAAARPTYRAEVVDMSALVAYVAAHPEWIGLLLPNTTGLNGLARSQRMALSIPGVRVIEEQGYAVRSA